MFYIYEMFRMISLNSRFISIMLTAFMVISNVGIGLSFAQKDLVSNEDSVLAPYEIIETLLVERAQNAGDIDLVSIPSLDGLKGKILTRPLPEDGPALLGPTKPKTPVYIISTIGEAGSGYHPFEPAKPLSMLFIPCPNEVAILIHGWSPNIVSALKDFDRASMSIDSNNYGISTIGVLWDSSTRVAGLPESEAWTNVKNNAVKAGSSLAKFLIDYKNRCEETSLRIIAHSVGSRVVDSVLSKLGSDETWNNNGYEIKSIHLLGAAITWKALDTRLPSGTFVQNYVQTFDNLYSLPDNGLVNYLLVEGDNALGRTGADPGIPKPINYKETNVASEILANNDVDGDGICDETTCDLTSIEQGQNHLGYWGFVSLGKHFLDDGAMNIVVNDWKKDSEIFKPDRTTPITPKIGSPSFPR